MCSNVRGLLDSPRAQKPSLKKILLTVVRHAQSVHNRMSNTGRPWDVGEATLSVVPGQSDYLLTALSPVGKVLDVITKDDSNPTLHEQRIPFFDVASLNQDWVLPNDAGFWVSNYDGSNHTAQRMAIVRQGNNLSIRVKPTPQLSADYRVLYSVGNWTEQASFDDSPILSEHHIYIETCAALSLLPYSQWNDDEAMNREKRQELGTVLDTEKTEQDGQLAAYIRTLTKAQPVTMRAYGDC